MRKQAAINVLMTDGTARRIPRDRAEQLIDSGLAKHYISQTVFKAMKLGIEVPNPRTRDTSGDLRAKIKEAKGKLETRSKKNEKRRKEEKHALNELHKLQAEDISIFDD